MDVFVYDDFHPEDNAMLQALYSRSPESVVRHIEKVKAAGSGKFMESYYIGYGHASIGDCGSTTVFVENVSMLVAKAIQDNPLYNGQEASTRYLDFSQQAQYDPYSHPASKAILRYWLDLYNDTLPKVVAGLEQRYPFNPVTDKKESAWQKAIKARAFDICRSLLPIGTTTLVSWHTNLRQARDHLRHMAQHPLSEVREVSAKIFDVLYKKYRNSFNGEELKEDSARYAERNAYANQHRLNTHFLAAERVLFGLDNAAREKLLAGEALFDNSLYAFDKLNDFERELLAGRPLGAPLPRRLLTYGVSTMTFMLDFGSFRDLQRHRNCIYQIPLTTAQFGFQTWYMEEYQALLPASDYISLQGAISRGLSDIAALPQQGVATTAMADQYLFPMGMASPTQMTHGLPQMVYLAELRSGKTVHPTARRPAQQLAAELKRLHPNMALYADFDDDTWTAKRGEQDIVEKAKAG